MGGGPDAVSWITIVSMFLTSLNTALAATIVYMTARDKLKYDAERLQLQNRIAVLEDKLKERAT